MAGFGFLWQIVVSLEHKEKVAMGALASFAWTMVLFASAFGVFQIWTALGWGLGLLATIVWLWVMVGYWSYVVCSSVVFYQTLALEYEPCSFTSLREHIKSTIFFTALAPITLPMAIYEVRHSLAGRVRMLKWGFIFTPGQAQSRLPQLQSMYRYKPESGF